MTVVQEFKLSVASLEVRWLHRQAYPLGEAKGSLAQKAKNAIASCDKDTFIWVACEKEDVRSIRSFLKARGHDRKQMNVAWYWERNPA